MEHFSQDCELVIALVSPVGVNLEDIETRLNDLFRQFRYSVNHIHLSKVADDYFKFEIPDAPDLPENPEARRIIEGMHKGTFLRQKYSRGDLYALLAIDFINRKRVEIEPTQGPIPFKRTVHLIRSLKHTEEVNTLRSVYGDGFFLLGVTSTTKYREHYLRKLKGVNDTQEIERLIARDDKEKTPKNLGQQTRDVFQLADAFVVTDDQESLTDQLTRILELLFSKPVVPPTLEEYSMFLAYAASLRSADLSRQVGAVIVNKHDDIIATGANDVPKHGGGLYWPNENDRRDYKEGYDFNEQEKSKILAEILSFIPDEEVGEEFRSKFESNLKKSKVMDLTEFGRAVHAEMECLMQAARNGIPVRGSRLYTTTYPCHNCAKHIVAAGIEEVVYIEPYPKSYAAKMHGDSIEEGHVEEAGQISNKVIFRQFKGVGPRHFVDLFSMNLSSGRKLKRKEEGTLASWTPQNAELRVPMKPVSYLESELKLVDELSSLNGGDEYDNEEQPENS